MAAAAHRLRVLVVDSDADARTGLVVRLCADARIGAVHPAGSAAEALRLLTRRRVDLVVSETHLPDMSGADLARILERFEQPPQLLFVTADPTRAVEAFDLHATDYLLKPPSAERLAESVRRVVAAGDPDRSARPRPPGPRDPATALGRSTRVGEPAADELVPVELGGVTRFVRRSEILYVQAQGDYVRLHTVHGSHLVRIALSSLEERWGAVDFVRIHRSTLVALRHVDEVRSDRGHYVVRIGPALLVVSRRHVHDLRRHLGRPTGPITGRRTG